MDSSNSSRERDQSRICADTIEEWNKVKQSFTDAMVATLNAKLGPGSSAEKDAMLAHLLEWKERTFEIAKPNVRVNGINMEEYVEEEEEEELELYDEVLDRRLWTHFSEGLSWQQTLASRRRTEPINAQKLIEDLLLREREFESEDTPPMLDVDIDPGTRGRWLPNEKITSIASVHEETVKMVEDWRESVPALLEKADRIEAVAAVDSRLAP